MKHIFLSICLALGTPAIAAADDPKPAPTDEGFSLMEEGARIFLRGLMQEVEPAMDDLKALAEDLQPNMKRLLGELGPTLNKLAALMEDATAYEAPQRLPNGDIIIRRKEDAPPLTVPDAPEIDL
ncbi:hypothetical protein [Algirhabdus cladophorae]|uniref:hypothetical protein n=1 Tax=Algirhabdus cladophorae TaxID=3377108 RepID=UPI003B8481D5